MSTICQSCAMPLENAKLGTNADGTQNQEHCEHCYKDGKYKWPAITMNGMIKSCIKHSVPHIYPDVETARNAMNALFPTLKRWHENVCLTEAEPNDRKDESKAKHFRRLY